MVQAQAAVSNRETVTGLLAATAHVFDRYPTRVEALGALVLEHLGTDAESYDGASDEPKTLDEALARVQRVVGAVLVDPRAKEITTQLTAEYAPPPYTRLPLLPGEEAAAGEPVSASLVVTAVILAAGAGALLGSVLPL